MTLNELELPTTPVLAEGLFKWASPAVRPSTRKGTFEHFVKPLDCAVLGLTDLGTYSAYVSAKIFRNEEVCVFIPFLLRKNACVHARVCVRLGNIVMTYDLHKLSH